MLARSALALAAAAALLTGCDSITGIGNLTFPSSTGPSDAQASLEDAGALEAGPPGPLGMMLASSESLFLVGVTSDGYAVYGDTSLGALYAVGVEAPDAGTPASNVPISLGSSVNVDDVVLAGPLVAFFDQSTENDLGNGITATLHVWSSSFKTPRTVAPNVLEPDLGNGYATVVASADGRYLAYLGSIDSTGATGTLFALDLKSNGTQTVAAPIDVAEDACEPGFAFSGATLVASYCVLADGGTVNSTLPDGGVNYDIATLSIFPPGGKATPLATNVSSGFALAPFAGEALFYGTGGLTAVALVADAGLVAIDPTATDALISNDGQTAYYTTPGKELMKAPTTPPAGPTVLATSSFNHIYQVSNDGSWALGSSSYDVTSGTGDVQLTSAAPAGTPPAPTKLSSDSISRALLGGSSFTNDSRYAFFLGGWNTAAGLASGTLTAFPVSGGQPTTIAQGTSWVATAAGSMLVYNSATNEDYADLWWSDLSQGPSKATHAVAQAGAIFAMGPASDVVVYTYAQGSSLDGLWALKIGPLCNTGPGVVYHPPAGSPGSCTAAEITTFQQQCIEQQNVSSTCAPTISGPCMGCLVSNPTDTSWGVAVNQSDIGGGVAQLNFGGCFATQGSTACGEAMQALLECEDAVCASSSDVASLQACQTAADSAQCACYSETATTACAPAATLTCNSSVPDSASFEQAFTVIAPIMCE
jgi:hypothetical protein